ncbi:uncharacterized protein LOC135481031 [Liolophura sinensis]|uniref:uncharacterized protein LOC135481031 n=1 Tax=Liolophura sinensis TaxID=3198878 RepID=UPI0031582B68
MTGFPQAEKSTELKTEEDKSETEMERQKNRSNKRAILAAGGASLLTAFVVIAVVISLYYGTYICQARNTPKTEKFFLIISESQSTGKVEVKDTERVIITETRTPNRTLHDTVALQDFNRKIQAIKDLDRNECFVSTFDIQFEEAKATVQGKETVFDLENYDTRTTVRSKETIPFQLAELALGSQVLEFCRNLPIYWLTDAKGSGAFSTLLVLPEHILPL